MGQHRARLVASAKYSPLNDFRPRQRFEQLILQCSVNPITNSSEQCTASHHTAHYPSNRPILITTAAKMSAAKRPASNSFGSSQIIVKRQKSNTDINGKDVAVTNGGSGSGALIQAVSSPLPSLIAVNTT